MPVTSPAKLPPLREGERLTGDEFLRRWEAMPDLKYAELIDGIVYMASPISDTHGIYHFRVSFWLGNYVAATPGCVAGSAGTWRMAPNDIPQPDLALRIPAALGGQSRSGDTYPEGAPELIVEVSYSTFRKDAGPKLQLYERMGVREYVTVRPKKRQVIWRELVDGKYRQNEPGSDGLLRSQVFPGLWLDPSTLWSDNLADVAVAVQKGLASEEHARFVRELASRKA